MRDCEIAVPHQRILRCSIDQGSSDSGGRRSSYVHVEGHRKLIMQLRVGGDMRHSSNTRLTYSPPIIPRCPNTSERLDHAKAKVLFQYEQNGKPKAELVHIEGQQHRQGRKNRWERPHIILSIWCHILLFMLFTSVVFVGAMMVFEIGMMVHNTFRPRRRTWTGLNSSSSLLPIDLISSSTYWTPLCRLVGTMSRKTDPTAWFRTLARKTQTWGCRSYRTRPLKYGFQSICIDFLRLPLSLVLVLVLVTMTDGRVDSPGPRVTSVPSRVAHFINCPCFDLTACSDQLRRTGMHELGRRTLAGQDLFLRHRLMEIQKARGGHLTVS